MAIKQVQVIKEGISRGRPPLNADIASIIQELVGSTPIEMKVDWLRSHQHPSRDIDGLLLSAKLNVRADALAERYLLMHPRSQTGYPHPNTPHFPQMGASMLIGNTRINSATSHRVRVAIQQKLYKKFFSEKHSIEFSYSNIHWVAFLKHLKPNRQMNE